MNKAKIEKYIDQITEMNNKYRDLSSPYIKNAVLYKVLERSEDDQHDVASVLYHLEEPYMGADFIIIKTIKNKNNDGGFDAVKNKIYLSNKLGDYGAEQQMVMNNVPHDEILTGWGYSLEKDTDVNELHEALVQKYARFINENRNLFIEKTVKEKVSKFKFENIKISTEVTDKYVKIAGKIALDINLNVDSKAEYSQKMFYSLVNEMKRYPSYFFGDEIFDDFDIDVSMPEFNQGLEIWLSREMEINDDFVNLILKPFKFLDQIFYKNLENGWKLFFLTKRS